MNVLIVHGLMGLPNENWFPWMKKELEKLGHKVIIPQFPTPEGHNLANWKKTLNAQKIIFDENLIIIAHSMGPAFVLSVLEDLKKPVNACFFIAGFIGRISNEEINELNNSFCEKDFNWKKIKRNCQLFFCYASDNDPYVPFEKSKELADILEAKLTLVKDAGHFNRKAGYLKFPILLEDLKNQK